MGNLCTRSSETNVFDEFPNESARDFHDVYDFDGFPVNIVDNLITRGSSFLKVKTECLDSDSKSAVSEECLDKTPSCLDSDSKSEFSHHHFEVLDEVRNNLFIEVPDDGFDKVCEFSDSQFSEVPEDDSLTFSSASSTPPSRVGSCWSNDQLKSFESLRKYDMENWIWKPEEDNIRRCKLTIEIPTPSNLWDNPTPPPGIPRLLRVPSRTSGFEEGLHRTQRNQIESKTIASAPYHPSS